MLSYKPVVGVAALLIATLWSNVSSAAPDCAQELLESRQAAGAVTVALKTPGPVKVGESIALEWQFSQTLSLKAPIYLVMATEEATRFRGAGFMALTPGAAAPWDIAYKADHSRILIPLHWKMSAGTKREIQIRPQIAKRHEIHAAIIYAGSCGEQALFEHEFTVDVLAGVARLTVQDRYSAGAPQKVIRSLNGRYDLHVFSARYEVYDAVSGDLLLSRAGVDPNFSPTGRFLASRREVDTSFEITDLLGDREPLPFIDPIYNEVLIWGLNDSYVVGLGSRWGMLGLYNITVDSGEGLFRGGDACNACSAWESLRLVLDVDRGFAASLSSKYDDGVVRIADLFQREPIEEIEQRNLVAHIRSRYDSAFVGIPSGWNLGGPIQLSHNFVSLIARFDAKGKPDRADTIARKKAFSERVALVVSHTPRPVAAGTLATASNQLIGTFRSGRPDRRDGLRTASNVRAPQAQPRVDAIIERSADLGMRVLSPLPITLQYEATEGANQGSGGSARLEKLLSPVWEDIKSGKTKIKLSDGTERSPSYFLDSVDRVYFWEQRGASYWLVSKTYKGGGSGVGSTTGEVFLISRAARSIEISAIEGSFGESGMTGWLTDVGRARVQRLTEKFVSIAVPLSETITIVDLTKPKAKPVQIPMLDAPIFAATRISADEQHVIQYNGDDRFFVSRLSDGKRMLTGSYIDDEVLLATQDGFYDSTFEGAQLANVRFDGMPGLHHFSQFEAILHRPGLARLVMAGQSASLEKPLAAPPLATLAVEQKPGREGERKGNVRVQSDSSVARVRIFSDGRQLSSVDVNSKRAEIPFTIPDPGSGHWISAVAVSDTGLVSLPSAVKIPGKVAAQGKLNAVLVGIDTYADKNISPLKQAKYDAQHLAGALSTLKGRTFSDVDPILILDAQATREGILDQVRAAAENTGVNDRLVLFFAGHGVDGKEFGDPDSGLYLVGTDTALQNVRETAISWKEISKALAGAKGTTIIMLDACHAGFAGKKQALSNDDAAAAMLTEAGGPMIILAASKGRQLSEEADSKGGRFTNAVVSALLSAKQGSSEALDLGEFYGRVKSSVMKETDNRQTPWLVRNGLVGEMTLF